jgi:hypothetical protein
MKELKKSNLVKNDDDIIYENIQTKKGICLML